MLTLEKTEIIPILTQFYAAKLTDLYLKEYRFHVKYKTFFEVFETKIKEETEENFETWDDYMEWKAFRKSILDLEFKLREIEHGTFSLA